MTKFWRLIFTLSLLGNLGIFYVAMKAIEYRNHINFFLDKYTTVVDEFSQRNVYAEANEKLKTSAPVPNRIVFFGTQVIERWKVDSLFAPEFEAINRGIYGQRVAGFLLRFKPDVIDLHPGFVFIEVSSYNFRTENHIREIEDYIVSMTQLAKANGIAPILTTTVPFRNKQYDLENNYQLGDSVTVYNNWVRQYAQENQLRLVDCNQILSDQTGFLPESVSFDDVDPNPAGYELLTKATRAVLAEQPPTP